MNGLTEDYPATGRELMLSQFHHAERLNALLTCLLNPYTLEQTALSELVHNRYLATAQGKQLDGVGDIVGISRPYVTLDGQWYFGFTGQSKAKGFSQAPIRDIGLSSASRSCIYMPDSAYARLIRWKIIANNAHGTVEDIIQAAKALYLAKKVQVVNTKNATVSITITAPASKQVSAFDDNPARWMPVCAGVLPTVTLNYT